MKITLKDGSVKEYQSPVTAAQAAKDLSMGLYRAACAARAHSSAFRAGWRRS